MLLNVTSKSKQSGKKASYHSYEKFKNVIYFDNVTYKNIKVSGWENYYYIYMYIYKHIFTFYLA